MGLYVSHLKNLPYGERSLYVYLLDYGWPEGPYEKIFRDNFQTMAKRASETDAIVIASHRGVHFANEVLSWHNVNGMDADTILPAILITKTHPNYFAESTDDSESAGGGLGDIVLIPLKSACNSPDDFLKLIESVFTDLEKGLELSTFRISQHQLETGNELGFRWKSIKSRLSKSFILEPKFAGVGVDLRKLFS